MQRSELAVHMQQFTQMHMRYMAEFLRLSSGPLSLQPCATGCTGSSAEPCSCRQEVRQLRETTLELESRLVRQDHLIRELSIRTETQQTQLGELRTKLMALEDSTSENQLFQGLYVWRLAGFSAYLKQQESGQSVVLHSPAFYTGRPGYKLCLRLHLQTATATRCSNYMSLFVHTMQGEFDARLAWPLQGTFRLAVLDQMDGQHHVEVMETKPELQAFQRPTVNRNPKGFGYVTFMQLQELRHRGFIRNDMLMVRCEVIPRPDPTRGREGVQPRGPEPSL